MWLVKGFIVKLLKVLFLRFLKKGKYLLSINLIKKLSINAIKTGKVQG